jgi:hypothetical protein
MSLAFKTILAKTDVQLQASVNTFLATLFGVSSVVITGFDVVLNDLQRYDGMQFSCMITYDTAGAAAQTGPFVMEIFDSGNAADLETAVATWQAANTDFTTGIRNVTFAQNIARLPRLNAWAVASSDAVDAPNNWVLV